jgi:hypothetical protein
LPEAPTQLLPVSVPEPTVQSFFNASTLYSLLEPVSETPTQSLIAPANEPASNVPTTQGLLIVPNFKGFLEPLPVTSQLAAKGLLNIELNTLF